MSAGQPYLSAGLPPAVVFVFPDEPVALAVATLADALVRGRIASLEDRQTAWPYRGESARPLCWAMMARVDLGEAA